MQQRKIDVVFYIPPFYSDGFGTRIPLTRVTPGQLKQLQESVANATLPLTNACPTSMTIRYEDQMSFLYGDARKEKISGRRRVLEISDLFYLAEYGTHCPACGDKKIKSELAATKYCAKNLRMGRCRDEFMRNTIGAALFPQFYAKDKQK